MLIKMAKKVGKIVDEVLRLAGDTGHFLMILKGNGRIGNKSHKSLDLKIVVNFVSFR